MYSQELLSRTTSVGTSAHSDIDSISRYVGEGSEISRLKPVSAKKLYFMVKPDWICGLLGTFGAVAVGAEMPLFALVSYYSDWETTKAEVKKITLLFTGGAVIAFFIHFLAHFNFGIMGERGREGGRQLIWREAADVDTMGAPAGLNLSPCQRVG